MNLRSRLDENDQKRKFQERKLRDYERIHSCLNDDYRAARKRLKLFEEKEEKQK